MSFPSVFEDCFFTQPHTPSPVPSGPRNPCLLRAWDRTSRLGGHPVSQGKETETTLQAGWSFCPRAWGWPSPGGRGRRVRKISHRPSQVSLKQCNCHKTHTLVVERHTCQAAQCKRTSSSSSSHACEEINKQKLIQTACSIICFQGCDCTNETLFFGGFRSRSYPSTALCRSACSAAYRWQFVSSKKNTHPPALGPD